MTPYIYLAVFWIVAIYCFINSYYAFKFPDKYVKAHWTVMRGLPREPSSAQFGGTVALLGGVLFFGFGLAVLHRIGSW